MERNTRIRASQIISMLPSDIDAINSPVDYYYIRKATGQDKWEWIAGAGGASNLSELNDVNLDSGTPTDLSILHYDDSSGVTKWKADKVLSIDGTFADNSDDNIPTEKAVKTYVDANSGGVGQNDVDDFTIKYVNNKIKVADRIELNIMLNFFHDAVDESRSVYNLVDGVIDEFEDETGIDTGASSGQTYNSTDDYYAPTPGGYSSDLTTGTTPTQSGGTNPQYGNDDNTGTTIPDGGNQSSGYWWEANISTSATVKKWTFRTGSNGTDVGRLTNVKLQGYNGATWADIDDVSSPFSTSTLYTRDENDFTNNTEYEDYRLVFTLSSPAGQFCSEIQLFSVLAPSNMILISEAVSAEVDPETARIVIFEEDVDSITLNTDIKAYISKDDGSTWAEITLEDKGNYDNNKRILTGIADLTASGIGSGSGNPIDWKVTTHNNKNLKLHGVAVSWN